MTQNRIMNWVGVLLFSFLFAASACNSSKLATTPQQVDGSYAAREKALLWQIQGKDMKKPSYLFGTIHMIKKEDFFMPEYVKTAFDKSKQVVFEIDMDDMNDMSMMGKIMNMMFIDKEDGRTLKDLLNEEDYKRVKSKLNENPMVALMGDMVDKIKPMFLSSMVSQDELGGSPMGGMFGGGDIDASKSYELEFTEMARKAKKPIHGLETIDFQMSIFDEISLEDQAKMLVEGLDADPKDGKNILEKMINMYKDQDIAGLYDLIKKSSASYKGFESKLLTKRNENWIPLMMKMMPKETHFFAVGAGHLGGEKGVIALLRKKGYILTPITK